MKCTVDCGQVHVGEQDLEAALLVSIQGQARILLQEGKGQENVNSINELDKQIQYCRTAIGRCKARQTAAFEDYAEGRITRQKYLSAKRETAGRNDSQIYGAVRKESRTFFLYYAAFYHALILVFDNLSFTINE